MIVALLSLYLAIVGSPFVLLAIFLWRRSMFRRQELARAMAVA